MYSISQLALVCKKSYQINESNDEFTFVSQYNSQFIYKIDGNELIICFRGSDEDQDWVNNFNFRKVQFHSNGKCLGKVHAGFQNYYLNIKNLLIDVVRSFLTDTPGGKVVISGHSLGGCCVLFAADVYETLTENVCVYTFGSPRVVNKEFFKNFNNDICVRVVNNDDAVSVLPSSLTFKHLGNLVLLRPDKPHLNTAKLIWQLFKNVIKCHYDKNEAILTKAHDIDSYIRVLGKIKFN